MNSTWYQKGRQPAENRPRLLPRVCVARQKLGGSLALPECGCVFSPYIKFPSDPAFDEGREETNLQITRARRRPSAAIARGMTRASGETHMLEGTLPPAA